MYHNFDKINTEINIESLHNIGKQDRASAREILTNILSSDSYIDVLFNPHKGMKQVSKQSIKKIWDSLTSPLIIHELTLMLDGLKNTINRNGVVLLYTIASIGAEANNERIDILAESKSTYTPEKYKYVMSKIEMYGKMVQSIFEFANTKMQPVINELQEATKLKRNVVAAAILGTPVGIITKDNVSIFTNNMLSDIYAVCNETGFSDHSAADVDWAPLFVDIFGEKLLPSVAVAILTENPNKISGMKVDVQEAWDSLSIQALYLLDRAPDGIRDQMIELYIKKVSRFREKTNLRLNILDVPVAFANVTSTVKKYNNAIDTIFKNNGNFNKMATTVFDGISNIVKEVKESTPQPTPTEE